jgi:ABC-2 type transport system permease protein
MWLTPLRAMVRKDLRLFITDRRAVIMSFVAPIAIASFFGSIFSGSDSERARVTVAIVDADRSTISKAIVAAATADSNLQVTTPSAAEARASVREGDITVGVLVPAGFGDRSAAAFFSGQEKPELTMWYDPSRSTELALVRGVLTQHVMEAVSREVFSGAAGPSAVDDALKNLGSTGLDATQQAALQQLLTSARAFYQSQPATGAPSGGGITMPYTVKQEAVTSGDNVAYNGYAHSFAGMGIQFLLFTAIDLGIGILLERQRGLWKRLRSAPLSRLMLLGGKAVSGSIVAFVTLVTSFGFAMLVFGVSIAGSVIGFLLVAGACAVMAATFGLLIASLGKTPGGSRGLASLAVLMMVMLGGAWVPTFLFPKWLQQATLVVPARWAVDGLDAMTWRGLPLSAAMAPTLALLGFAALFATMAVLRFRWEEG